MSKELQPGTLLQNRYIVKKTVSFAETGGVYVVQDIKVTERSWILKEIIPPSLEKKELESRRDYLHQALIVLSQTNQDNLSSIIDFFTEYNKEYVVMEYVEGITLKTLSQMSITPLSQREVLGWGAQICDALLYLHDRPQPFIFEVLELDHIMLTSDGRIKLINYGLNRFFRAATDSPFIYQDFKDITAEINRFGEAVYLLLAREMPGQYRVRDTLGNITPELQKLLTRCLIKDPARNYRSFAEIRKEIDTLLAPPAPPAQKAPAARKPTEQKKGSGLIAQIPFPVREAVGTAVFTVLGQKLEYLIGEIVLVLALFAFIWVKAHPGYNYTRSGPVFYILSGDNQVNTFDFNSKKMKHQLTVEGRTGDIVYSTHKTRLYVSLTDQNRILVLEPEHNIAVKTINVDRGPGSLALSPAEDFLYVLHPATSSISIVSTEKNAMVGILNAGPEPYYIAASRQVPLLFVTNRKADTVTVIDPSISKVVDTIALSGGPSGIAFSPVAREFWVAQEGVGYITVLAMGEEENTFEATGTVTGLGDMPTTLLFSGSGKQLYVANTLSNSISVVNAEDKQVTASIPVGRRPGPMAWDINEMLWVLNTGSANISVVNTLTRAVEFVIGLPGHPRRFCLIR
jgi:YVTN family beta-propeller protein